MAASPFPGTDAFPAAELGPKTDDPRRGDYLAWLAWYVASRQCSRHFGGSFAPASSSAVAITVLTDLAGNRGILIRPQFPNQRVTQRAAPRRR